MTQCALAPRTTGASEGNGRRQRRSPGGVEDFFALWKDADPDVPVLKEAKAEYGKLP